MMLLMGMKISFTKNPTNPITTNPMERLTRRMLSLANSLRGSMAESTTSRRPAGTPPATGAPCPSGPPPPSSPPPPPLEQRHQGPKHLWRSSRRRSSAGAPPETGRVGRSCRPPSSSPAAPPGAAGGGSEDGGEGPVGLPDACGNHPLVQA
ncbi:unnamed protein product [Spirodela intermedia]|uniref:Uncharacterized protein n=1 Tax=Spirodela intermedia TaxID=51605 RepID=A0A7I8LLU4_SPIIN|nr:unnamed protein product [Spirodela intermedia]